MVFGSKSRSMWRWIGNTLVLGVVFLLPVGMVVLVVGKVVAGMRGIARLLAPVLPVETLGGLLLLNLAAFVLILGVCLLGGVVAQRAASHRLVDSMDRLLLSVVPGYGILRGIGDSMRQSEDRSNRFKPVWIDFDDYTQLAFAVGDEEPGKVLAYLPGAPNPWSGAIVHVAAERVRACDLSVAQAIATIRRLGEESPAVPLAPSSAREKPREQASAALG